MFTIHLNKCRFYAYHGLHKEEAVAGASFEVSLSACFNASEKVVSMSQTINYVDLYEMVKRHFANPRQLLETLAQEIAEDVYLLDSRVSSVEVHLTKLNPPIANFTGSVGVSYTKHF